MPFLAPLFIFKEGLHLLSTHFFESPSFCHRSISPLYLLINRVLSTILIIIVGDGSDNDDDDDEDAYNGMIQRSS